MAVQLCSNQLKTYPTGLVGTTVPNGGPAWANPAWTQIISSTPADWVLTGIIPLPGVGKDYEIDIGVGSAGLETVIATFKGYSNLETTTDNGGRYDFRIPIDAIPSGSRVSARYRTNTVLGTIYNATVFLTYIEKPISGSIQTTTQPIKVYPSNSIGFTVTPNAAAWTLGSWVEVITSLSTDIVIAGWFTSETDYANFEWELGTGTVGNEVTKARFRGRHSDNNSCHYAVAVPHPTDAFPAGARLSARCKVSLPNVGVHFLRVGFHYYEKPL